MVVVEVVLFLYPVGCGCVALKPIRGVVLSPPMGSVVGQAPDRGMSPSQDCLSFLKGPVCGFPGMASSGGAKQKKKKQSNGRQAFVGKKAKGVARLAKLQPGGTRFG